MREVRTGVWHWEARHPEWNERQWWGPLVSSYAIDGSARLTHGAPADGVALERALATSPS